LRLMAWVVVVLVPAGLADGAAVPPPQPARPTAIMAITASVRTAIFVGRNNVISFNLILRRTGRRFHGLVFWYGVDCLGFSFIIGEAV
jgi:hypothetical protein